MNKTEAANFLGVSERTLLRYVESKRIRAEYKKGKTGPVAVFAEEDLAKLKAELEAPFAPSTAIVPVAPSFAVPANPAPTPEPPDAPTVPIHHLATLSVEQAATLYNVSRSAITRAIAAGELRAFSGYARGRRVRRRDLDKWVEKWK